MKIAKVLMFSLLVLPMMGADDNGCGGGMAVAPPTEPQCSPKTCGNGCCVGDVCVTNGSNKTRDTCGSFGVACEKCQTLQSCKEDTVKGWACLADTATDWSVQPVDASLPLLDPNDGAAWDADDSAPDVVVELRCPTSALSGIGRTSEVSSHTPKWNDGACSARAEELLRSPVTITIIDADAFFDDAVFSGSYAFKEADFEKGLVEIPIFTDGSSKLRLQLSRVR